jgi:hypothetical protein
MINVKSIEVAVSVALLGLTMFLAFLSLQLRPIADDYCIGSLTREKGVFEALAWWFMNWQGDYASATLVFLLIGLPVAFFPFELASAFSFVLVLGTLSFLGTTFLRQTGGFKKFSSSFTVFLGLIIPIAWFAYWWSVTLLVENDTVLQGPRAITNWQGINVQYVLPVLISTIWAIQISKNLRSWKLPLIITNATGLGLFVGGSGLVLSLFGVVTGLIFLTLSITPWHRERTWASPAFFGSFFLANALGFLVAYNAPGVGIRRNLHFQNLEDPTLQTFVSGAHGALIEWQSVVFSPGTVLALTIFILLGSFASQDENKEKTNWIAFSGWILFASLVFNLISQTASHFSYDAFWHLTPTYVLVFFATSLFGYQIGELISGSEQKLGLLARIFASLLTFLFIFMVLLTALRDTSERLEAWKVGPAPFVGIADIENTDVVYGIPEENDLEVGFLGCWNDLGSMRDVPVRTENPEAEN